MCSANSSHKPDILAVRQIAKSRLFNVEEVDLQFGNGQRRTFERCGGNLLTQGSVLVVPILGEDTLVLIREYAAGLDSYELGFPKGLIDEGETPEIAANRELKEEAGFGARQIDFLKIASTSPHYMKGKMRLMLARDLYSEHLPGDEPEPLEVITWPLANYQALLAREDFTASMNISALCLALEYLKK